jgi:branched-subunit amino acid transport protein
VTAAGAWLVFAAMGIVTLALRASFLLLQDRAGLPPLLRRALAYVPPAVLAAIVAPALFAPGTVALGPVDARLPAGLVAIVVAWRTKSVLATLGAGMAVLWTLTWLANGAG